MYKIYSLISNHLYLVVDAENKGAWNVYERAGFMHTATKEEGPIGKERLYYLDLDSKHVSSLRLTENEASSISSYSVVDLLKDNQKVGFIALEKRIIELILLLLKCIKNNEKKVSLKVH